MRARILYVIPVVLALLFGCSTRANAQFWTYGFYSIVDNTGATLSSTTGAGLNVAGCSYSLSGTVYRAGCTYGLNSSSQFAYNALQLQFTNIGGHGCGDLPPLPFQEYDPTVYPTLNSCYTESVNGLAYAAGTSRCAPGQPSSQANPCELPYLFTAVPSATSSTGMKLVPSQWQVTYTSNNVPTIVPCLEPDGSLTCTSYGIPDGAGTGMTPFVKLIYAPLVSCAGFQAPFNNPIALQKNSKRAIPLIIQLLDQNNNVITPTTLNGAPPVVTVTYTSASSSAVQIPSDELLSTGQSSSGNQFTFNSSTNTWQFNLDTSPLMAPGTYTVSVQGGDGTKYALSGCSQSFTR